MLVLINRHVTEWGSQFVIATHSPILMAYPNALIYQLSSDGRIEAVSYEQTEHFQVTRDFLNDRESYFRHLFSDDEDPGPDLKLVR
jgi:predicted ATPase